MKTIDIKNTDGEVVHSFTSKNNSFSKTLKNYMQKKLQENNTTTEKVELFNLDLSNQTIERLFLGTVDVIHFNFCTFNNTSIVSSTLKNITFNQSSFNGVKMIENNFYYCNFINCNFTITFYDDYSFLEGNVFNHCRFFECDFTDAIIRHNRHFYTSLNNTIFRNTSFTNNYFYDCTLLDNDFYSANFYNTEFRNSSLDGNLTNSQTLFFNLQCPEEGAFIGWKKCSNYIVKLQITADAKRTSATSHKCRASKALVLDIQKYNGEKAPINSVASNYDPSFIYEVGKIVKVENFNTNRWDECSTGIHFFINRENASYY